MSTLISPVTHTAEVDVKHEVKNGVTSLLREEIGRLSNPAPISIKIINPNKISLNGETDFIRLLRAVFVLSVANASLQANFLLYNDI